MNGVPWVKKKKRKKNDTLESPWCGLAAVWVYRGRAPLPMPMVSSERNGVCEGPALTFRRSWGWGRTAMRARNVPGGIVVSYSGRA